MCGIDAGWGAGVVSGSGVFVGRESSSSGLQCLGCGRECGGCFLGVFSKCLLGVC